MRLSKQLIPILIGIGGTAAVGLHVWSEISYFHSEADEDLQELAADVNRYNRAVGRWPQALKDLTPPHCVGDACLRLGIPQDEFGRDIMLINEAGCLYIVSLGHDAKRSADDRFVIVQNSCSPRK